MVRHGQIGGELYCRIKTFGGEQGAAQRLRVYFVLEDDILFLLIPAEARAWWNAAEARKTLTVQIGAYSLQGAATEVRDSRMQRRVQERFTDKYRRIQYLLDMQFQQAVLLRLKLVEEEEPATQ